MLLNMPNRTKAVFMGILIALLIGHSPVLAESPGLIEAGLIEVGLFHGCLTMFIVQFQIKHKSFPHTSFQMKSL